MTPETKSKLEKITTATLTTVLLKKGLRNVWLRGARPFTPAAQNVRLVGPAFTLRFVPAREELTAEVTLSLCEQTRPRARATVGLLERTFLPLSDPEFPDYHVHGMRPGQQCRPAP